MKLNLKQIFLILTSFQIVWLSCIFGEYFKFPLLGVFAGLVYLFIFFYNVHNKARALKICLIFSILGYSFDSLNAEFKIYYIKSELIFGSLPIWFLLLWLCFSTLLVDVLVFFKKIKIISIIISAIIVPITYYSGFPLGIASSSNIILALIIISIFWATYVYVYTIYLEKFDIK